MSRRSVLASPSDNAAKTKFAGGVMVGDEKVTPLRAKRRCPECGRPSGRADYPFCSPRCKTLDLNRWLSGAYVIPASDEDEPPQSSEDERF